MERVVITSLESSPVLLAVFIGSLSLLPILFITTTAFLKISMVLMIVRNALGVQQVPPSMAIYSIALGATFFVMAPVFQSISNDISFDDLAIKNEQEIQRLVNLVKEPLLDFMLDNTQPEISSHLKGVAKETWPQDMYNGTDSRSIFIAIPAFVISELQSGFKIGFLIYIPFVVIDLIVSNILLALGMQMVAPITVTVPIKILLFVLVDGWTKLFEGLIYSYL